MDRYRLKNSSKDYIITFLWDGESIGTIQEFCGKDNVKVEQYDEFPNENFLFIKEDVYYGVWRNENGWIFHPRGYMIAKKLNCSDNLKPFFITDDDYLSKNYIKVDNVSDGYHTFNELYEYRKLYNALAFNELAKNSEYKVVKSKRHHTGEECFGGGWFIVMAELPTGQISNHYELKDWDLFHCKEVETAPEWDGHTPEEAANRIKKFINHK